MAFDLTSISTTQRAPTSHWAITGESFTGKTSLAAEFPSPVFLFTEESKGLLQVQALNGGNVYTQWVNVVESLHALHSQEHQFKTLVIDSIDHLEHIIFAQVMADAGVDRWEALSYGKGYAAALAYWQQLMQWTQAICRDREMHVVFTVHVEAKKFEPPGEESYDHWQWAMHQKAAQYIQDNIDTAIFIKNAKYVTQEESGFNKKRNIVIDGGGMRTMCTNNSAAFYAKNRFNLPAEMPYQLGQGWATIEAALNGAAPQAATAAPPPVAPAA